MAGGKGGANGQGQEARKTTSPAVQSVIVLGGLYYAVKDGWAWQYVPPEFAEQARIGLWSWLGLRSAACAGGAAVSAALQKGVGCRAAEGIDAFGAHCDR